MFMANVLTARQDTVKPGDGADTEGTADTFTKYSPACCFSLCAASSNDSTCSPLFEERSEKGTGRRKAIINRQSIDFHLRSNQHC